MSSENNKNLVHRFYDALENGDYATVTGMLHDDFVFYSQIDTPRPGVDGFLAAEKKNVEAFGGIRMTVEHTVADGDRVGAYVVVEGQQAGEFNGPPPVGAPMRFSMLNLFTFRTWLTAQGLTLDQPGQAEIDRWHATHRPHEQLALRAF